MLINSMLANSNELIHFHSLSPLFMSDDMSWFCTKMSLFIPQPAHASSLVRFFVFRLLLLLLSIFICVDLLSQSLLRFVIGVDICWTVKHLRWHSNAFSRASKMVNMNNHMIIFPSSPYWVRMVHVYLYTLCTHTLHWVYPFFSLLLSTNMLLCISSLLHEHVAVRWVTTDGVWLENGFAGFVDFVQEIMWNWRKRSSKTFNVKLYTSRCTCVRCTMRYVVVYIIRNG